MLYWFYSDKKYRFRKELIAKDKGAGYEAKNIYYKSISAEMAEAAAEGSGLCD